MVGWSSHPPAGGLSCRLVRQLVDAGFITGKAGKGDVVLNKNIVAFEKVPCE